jgi:flagellar L-ring protein precursor FlgH
MNLHTAILALSLFSPSLLLLSGCTIARDARPGDPAYAPVTAAPVAAVPASAGGLYRVGPNASATTAMSLFEDRRARNVGDVITIVLSESTSSKKSADTKIDKSDSIDIGTGLVLGEVPSLHNLSLETQLSGERAFDGGASSDQSNSLNGTITVTVAEVMPNGLLEVRGEKWLTLNRGDEFIRIRGYVRPEDVLPNNTVSSTKVADVRITYSGNGELAQSNRQGWLSRFFSSEFWPF